LIRHIFRIGLFYQEDVMKNQFKSAVACFLLSFFAYFRYLLAASVILIIGSFFFQPLIYAGLLALALDFFFSIAITVHVSFIVPVFKDDFPFQKDP